MIKKMLWGYYDTDQTGFCLRNKFPDIRKMGVNEVEPSLSYKNGYGAMVVLSLEAYFENWRMA